MIPRSEDRAAWKALRDLPRSHTAAALAVLAADRGISPGKLRTRLISAYGAEAKLLPVPSVDPAHDAAARAAARRAIACEQLLTLLQLHPDGLPLASVAGHLHVTLNTAVKIVEAAGVHFTRAESGRSPWVSL